MRWFDGHLDLTYIALHGRDLTRDAAHCGGTLLPASVTFPALAAADVRAAFSTIFVRKNASGLSGDFCFESDDEAHAAAWRQVEMHRTWERNGWIENDAASSVVPTPPSAGGGHEKTTTTSKPLHTILALEGAACLRTPDDVEAFYGAGVRMLALAWAEGSRWAGGDQSGGDVTADGKTLIGRLDHLKIVHDVSHLSEKAFWTLLDTARGRVVASHSNCRALLPDAKFPQRHLSDAQIAAIAARGGKIGINLFARFLIPAAELQTRRATIADVVRHLTHMESVAGRRDLLALGSDMDSGFGTELLPADLQGPADLHRLAEALAGAGWSDGEIQQFAWGWDL